MTVLAQKSRPFLGLHPRIAVKWQCYILSQQFPAAGQLCAAHPHSADSHSLLLLFSCLWPETPLSLTRVGQTDSSAVPGRRY